jgi:hypothetical protein
MNLTLQRKYSMDEKIDIKIFSIPLYYIFCIIIYILLLIGTMLFVFYSTKIFGIITPNFLKKLYINYNWLKKVYFYVSFIIPFVSILFLMDLSRKLFEKNCAFIFSENYFTFFLDTKKYIIKTNNIINIKCYKKTVVLHTKKGDVYYYKIIIYTEKEKIKINTQILKSVDSFLNTAKLIDKLKEYYKELKVINNTTLFKRYT